MKMKICKLEKGPMIFTGSKVLELIQDNYTPPIDLLVRETIQNCADAILDSKKFGKVNFQIGKFNKNEFSSKLDGISNNINKTYLDDDYDYLALSDYFTSGLLGKPEKEKDEPNNLYNLVYDVMNSKTGSAMGGSHGIGKSIYYRYGIGICLYYSRTFENGIYINKLAGALIQNENNLDCLLGKDTSGIAYFGDISNNKSIPIYNDDEISELLSCFGLKLYSGDQTGTTVIIPFFNKEKMISNLINNDCDNTSYWLSDFEKYLNISIQRWYFPRINNEQYNGKYLIIGINNKKIILNPFFEKLQQLYNGTLDGCTNVPVSHKFLSSLNLGNFNYKVFDKEELGMNPPENLPTPRFLTDSSLDVDNNGLLFYLRKPGMVISYDNEKFGSYTLDEDKFLIGMFILNDEANYENENLGAYFRKSEEANHKRWDDINDEKFINLNKKKPFSKICNVIKNHLNETFKKANAVKLEGSNTLLQKKLGSKLMPPSGFGSNPEPKTRGEGSINSGKKGKKWSIDLVNISEDGDIKYLIKTTLKSNENFTFYFKVKAGSKSYSFMDWKKLQFELPFIMNNFEISKIIANKKNLNCFQHIPFDNDYIRRKKKNYDNVEIYKVRGIATQDNVPCGIKVHNVLDKDLTLELQFKIKPISNKYEIGFDMSFGKGEI